MNYNSNHPHQLLKMNYYSKHHHQLAHNKLLYQIHGKIQFAKDTLLTNVHNPHGINGNRLVNGERCKDNHPRRCYSFCNFGTKQRIGCQKGNSCPKFHPKLCRNSLRSSACYNDNCKFVHLKSTKRERNESETPDHRHQSHPREHQPRERLLVGLPRSRPTAPAQYHQNQTRFDSSLSQQLRTEVPPTQYQNNSSDISFLVRMIQDTKSDFQKDLTQLKESVYQQNIRWNPLPPPTAPPLPHHLAQTNNPQELRIPHLPPQQRQTMPLWSQNIPQFFSYSSIYPAASSPCRWKIPFISENLLNKDGSNFLIMAITESWLKK